MIREVIVLAGVLIRWHRKVVLKKYVSKRFGCFCHKYVKFAYLFYCRCIYIIFIYSHSSIASILINVK